MSPIPPAPWPRPRRSTGCRSACPCRLRAAHDLAGERQAARALVGGLGADDRVGDPCDIMVLHVPADAAQLVHDRHADMSEMPTPDNCNARSFFRHSGLAQTHEIG